MGERRGLWCHAITTAAKTSEVSVLLSALWLSFLAGTVATSLGALPIAILPRPSEANRRLLTGFAGGVMLSASMFSLAGPALELRGQAWGPGLWTLGLVAVSFTAGAALVDFLNRVIPHEHFIKGPEHADTHGIRRMWLFVLAMTLHNFPEGMAVGVGSALEGPAGLTVAIGIGLQNVPEGLVVAAALLDKGFSRRTALLVAVGSGAVEPVGALVGAGVISVSAVVLPAALLFAAGAMVYVVALEVLPESHEGGHARAATWSAMAGFVLNMVLDAALT